MSVPLFLESQTGVPLVHLCLLFSDGALQDPTGKEGTTRLLCRLLRRTALGRSAQENDDWLDSHGASVAPECNRSSNGWSATVIARNLPATLNYLEEMLLRPDFNQQEFERLLAESLAEWEESLDDDASLARRFFSQAYFEGHPYQRLVGGTPASIKRITLDELRARHQLNLEAFQAALSVAGDCSGQSLLNFHTQLQERIQSDARGNFHPDTSGQNGRQLLFVNKPDRAQTQIIIGGAGTSPHDEDYLALHVAHTAFGGTFTARLNDEVRAKRGWSYGAYSHLPIDRSRQAFSLWTFPQKSDALACIQLELKLLEDFVERGLSKAELARTKRYLIKSHPFQIDSAQKRVGRALDRWFFGLSPDFHERYLERVRAITLEEVHDALRRRIDPKNQLICVVGSQDGLYDDLREKIEGLSRARIISHRAEQIEEAEESAIS